MNLTNNRGRGRPKKEVAPEEKQTNYMRGLSAMVNKACDEWLEKRGMKKLSWKEQQNASAKRNAAKKK